MKSCEETMEKEINAVMHSIMEARCMDADRYVHLHTRK